VEDIRDKYEDPNPRCNQYNLITKAEYLRLEDGLDPSQALRGTE